MDKFKKLDKHGRIEILNKILQKYQRLQIFEEGTILKDENCRFSDHGNIYVYFQKVNLSESFKKRFISINIDKSNIYNFEILCSKYNKNEIVIKISLDSGYGSIVSSGWEGDYLHYVFEE